MMYRDLGRINDAEQELKRVLRVNPNFIPALFLLGSFYQEDERYDEAVVLYRQAVDLDPSYDKALKNLGIIHMNVYNHQTEAAEYFKRYLQIKPDDPQREAIQRVIDRASSSG